MKSLALIIARCIQTLRVEPGSLLADLCDETAEALRTFYAADAVPAAEIHLVEQLILDRYLAACLEAVIGERGLFIAKGDDPYARLHPAVNAAIRARGRYAKIMRDLAKRHAPAAKTPTEKPIRSTQALPNPGASSDLDPVPGVAPSPCPSVPVPPAPNAHTVAPDPERGPANAQTSSPLFMNRATRRQAGRDAAKAARTIEKRQSA